MQRYHAMPGDFFRYTPEGASALFTQAGFTVLATQQIGDERITTGVDMGFGMADFAPAYLARHLRTNWSDARSRQHNATQFINCAMVLVRKNQTVSTVSAVGR